jgi:hypothetical protein
MEVIGDIGTIGAMEATGDIGTIGEINGTFITKSLITEMEGIITIDIQDTIVMADATQPTGILQLEEIQHIINQIRIQTEGLQE